MTVTPTTSDTSRRDVNQRFDINRVTTIAAGHTMHDMFTAFLPALLPVLIVRLSLSKTQAGLLIIFLQSSSIFQPIIGHLGDRAGLRYLVIAAPAITATMMSLVGIAPSFMPVIFLLLIAGFNSSGLHAIGPAFIGRLSGSKLGRGMSFWMVGGEFGRTLGPIVLVTAIRFMTLERTPILMILGWITSVILFFRLRQVPLNPPENDKEINLRSTLMGMKNIMLPVFGIVAMMALLRSAIGVFIPTYLTEAGAGLWLAGASFSLMEGAGVIGAFFGGSLSDRFGRRQLLFIAVIGAPLFLLAFLYTSGWLQGLVLIGLGISALSATPVLMAVVQESFPENRALANGIYMAVGFVLRSIAIIFVGAMGDFYDLRLAFTISAIFCIFALPFIFFLPKATQAVNG